jgi:hypothetical protein
MDRTGERLSLVAIFMTLSLFGTGVPDLTGVACPGFASITCSVDGGVKHGDPDYWGAPERA